VKSHLAHRLIFFVLLGGLLSLPLVGHAGEGQRGRGKGHHDPNARLQRMTETLDLSAEQRAELKPILEEQAEAFRAMRERKQAGEAPEKLRSERRARRDANDTAIEAVLTEDQVAEFRSRRAEQKAKRGERSREHKREGRGEAGPPEDAS
jgi:hypothetical protein